MEAAEYTIDSHFAGSEPTVREIYDRLISDLNDLGTVAAEPKKTCIHLNRKSALAGVYVRRSYINLEFKTDYSIDSPRIAKSEQVSRSRYHHVTKLETMSDLDSELLGWLKDAHRLSS